MDSTAWQTWARLPETQALKEWAEKEKAHLLRQAQTLAGERNYDGRDVDIAAALVAASAFDEMVYAITTEGALDD